MEINPNRSVHRFNKPVAGKGASKTGASGDAAPPAIDRSIAASLGSLEGVLESLPEERPERLEEGRVLKDDPQYPSEGELRDLSGLVIRSESQNPESDGPARA